MTEHLLKTEVTEEEFNKMLDDWVAERSKHVGDIYVPPVGVWPPDPRVSFSSSHNNEWVTTDLIRHYADGIGDRNPLWRSEDYAKRTRWGGIIAPPTFIDCIAPTFLQDKTTLPPGVSTLVAGGNMRFFQVMRPGDRIRIFDRYLGITEKQHKDKEKKYRLFWDVTRRTYINQREEVVAYADAPIICSAIGRGDHKAAYPTRELTKYTQEYIDLIHRTYDEEKPRGAEPLLWEDVVVGEELKPVVAGPLDATDSAVYLGALGYTGAFSYKWERQKRSLWASVLDPATNTMHIGVEQHLNHDIAKLMVGTKAFAYGGQSQGLICHLVTNWMGDDGFLKSLDCQMRRMWMYGETAWLKGKVAKKYVEGNEHLVDLEVRAENQDGLVFMPGTATVRLVSRTDR